MGVGVNNLCILTHSIRWSVLVLCLALAIGILKWKVICKLCWSMKGSVLFVWMTQGDLKRLTVLSPIYAQGRDCTCHQFVYTVWYVI